MALFFLLGKSLMGFVFDVLFDSMRDGARQRNCRRRIVIKYWDQQTLKAGLEIARIGTQPLGTDCEAGPSAV